MAKPSTTLTSVYEHSGVLAVYARATTTAPGLVGFLGHDKYKLLVESAIEVFEKSLEQKIAIKDLRVDIGDSVAVQVMRDAVRGSYVAIVVLKAHTVVKSTKRFERRLLRAIATIIDKGGPAVGVVEPQAALATIEPAPAA